MHACPCFLHLGVTVDSNALFYVPLLPTGLKQCLLCKLAGLSLRLWRGCGGWGPWVGGGEGSDAHFPPFKTPTLNTDTLRPQDTTRDGYRLKMLLFALDELFYIYLQVKKICEDRPRIRDTPHLRQPVHWPMARGREDWRYKSINFQPRKVLPIDRLHLE